MATIKELKEKYGNKQVLDFTTFDGTEYVVRITKFKAFTDYHDGTKYLICCSDYKRDGIPWGVDVEMIIRVSDGVNMIDGRSRPADNLSDAVDVACEMLWYGDGL